MNSVWMVLFLVMSLATAAPAATDYFRAAPAQQSYETTGGPVSAPPAPQTKTTTSDQAQEIKLLTQQLKMLNQTVQAFQQHTDAKLLGLQQAQHRLDDQIAAVTTAVALLNNQLKQLATVDHSAAAPANGLRAWLVRWWQWISVVVLAFGSAIVAQHCSKRSLK